MSHNMPVPPRPSVKVVGDYVVLPTDETIFVDLNGGDSKVTLPASLGKGRQIQIVAFPYGTGSHASIRSAAGEFIDPNGPNGGGTGQKYDIQGGDSCTVLDTGAPGDQWAISKYNNRMELADTGGAELVGRQQGGSVQATITDLPEAFVDDNTPADGTFRINGQPATNSTFALDFKGTVVTFEFTIGLGLTVGDVEVIKGGTTALTATAFQAALDQALGDPGLGVLYAFQHGTDDTVIDWLGQGNPLITNGTAGAVVVNARNQGKSAERTTYFHRHYEVQPEDVNVGHLILFLGPSDGGNVTGSFRIRTSNTDNTEVLYDGSVVFASHKVEFNNGGGTDLAAGHIVEAWGKATYD
jgi:hypothetical protein